jgi:hypothetical protein
LQDPRLCQRTETGNRHHRCWVRVTPLIAELRQLDVVRPALPVRFADVSFRQPSDLSACGIPSFKLERPKVRRDLVDDVPMSTVQAG